MPYDMFMTIENIKLLIKKINWYNLLLFFILFFGIFLRLKGLLMNPSFWHDECALGWNIKFKSCLGYFGLLRFAQMASPFFMILIKLTVKIFGFSDLTLRIVPFLAGVFSIIAFYFLSKNVFKNKLTILAAVFLFAINKSLINYSFQFKPYCLDVLFTIICILSFLKLDLEKLTLKKTFLYGVLLSFIPWFSFVSVFTLASGWLSIAFKNIKSDWIKKNILIIPIIISGLLYLKIYLFKNYTDTGLVNYWSSDFVTSDIRFFFYLLIENIKYLFYPIKYNLFALILLIWGAALFYMKKSRFANIGLMSFLLLIFASCLKLYPFFNRLVLFLIPIFLIFMLKPLDLLKYNKKLRSAVIMFIILVTFLPQVKEIKDFLSLKTISRGENPRQMMLDLAKNVKDKEIILVPDLSDTEFAYYSIFYNLKNQVIQERKQNSEQVLESLRGGHYCWIFNSFNNPENIFNWIIKNAIVIKVFRYPGTDNKLIYIYVK